MGMENEPPRRQERQELSFFIGREKSSRKYATLLYLCASVCICVCFSYTHPITNHYLTAQWVEFCLRLQE
ncbi:hypothetical protein [Fischerella thermalis]|jgi:hypothetical protein|uniref:hypothetical protein n=1 Tax=Fischerella thermalis TaxID=372787 RepID=UPI0015E0B58B|nr:hypothetical protein [Fischerella thermalis]